MDLGRALALESRLLPLHAAAVKTPHPCTFRSACVAGPIVALALATTLLVPLATTSAQQPAARKVATVEGITEYQFDNGLRALLFPDNSQSKVTVNLTVLVGSRHEGYGETGMAHLLEHLVFKGTPDASQRSEGAAGSRRAVQRQHLGRSHELFRDARRRPTRTWNSPSRWKPTG